MTLSVTCQSIPTVGVTWTHSSSSEMRPARSSMGVRVRRMSTGGEGKGGKPGTGSMVVKVVVSVSAMPFVPLSRTMERRTQSRRAPAWSVTGFQPL